MLAALLLVHTYICSLTDQLSHRTVGLTDNTAVIHSTQYNSNTNTQQHTVATSNKHAACSIWHTIYEAVMFTDTKQQCTQHKATCNIH